MAPKRVVAKIIMQQICKGGRHWDEGLESMTFNRWLEFVDDCSYIDRINIPHWVNLTLSKKYFMQFVMLLGKDMLLFRIVES